MGPGGGDGKWDSCHRAKWESWETRHGSRRRSKSVAPADCPFCPAPGERIFHRGHGLAACARTRGFGRADDLLPLAGRGEALATRG